MPFNTNARVEVSLVESYHKTVEQAVHLLRDVQNRPNNDVEYFKSYSVMLNSLKGVRDGVDAIASDRFGEIMNCRFGYVDFETNHFADFNAIIDKMIASEASVDTIVSAAATSWVEGVLVLPTFCNTPYS